MVTVTTLGIDIAKNVFQLHGVDHRGVTVLKKRLQREHLLSYLAQLPSCTVGIEACGGSHYWGRELTNLGHDAKIMSPQHVKPYIKTNKSDKNDAEGICEAVSRPNMRYVPIKSVAQQDIQLIHRSRSLLQKEKTAKMNSTRGLLHEYGIAFRQGKSALYEALAEVTSAEYNGLSESAKNIFARQYDALRRIDEDVAYHDKKVKELSRADAQACRIMQIPGIGELSATALCAAITSVHNFKNGRELSAWLGLVPRQCSSGNKQRLLGISKRGDKYLRSLLVHGARSVIVSATKKEEPDKHERWIVQLVSRCGWNKAAVAIANKTLRIVYAVLSTGESYNPEMAHGDFVDTKTGEVIHAVV